MNKSVNVIIHDDCMNVMRQLTDKSIDLVLTDPPSEYFENKEPFLSEMRRVSKDQIIWGHDTFKGRVMGEDVWTILKLHQKTDKVKYHKSQKPLELWKWLVEKFSKPGDTILDPFAGSGTTAIACIETKRNYIVIDIEEKCVKVIQQRVSSYGKFQGRV